MRMMVIVKATKDSEEGTMPSTELLEAMGRYNEELVKAGIMLAGDGLKPSSQGKRVAFDGPGRTVIDGPFAETRELVAGYWLWEVRDMAEAVEWVKRCPNPMPGPGEIEMPDVRSLLRMGRAMVDLYCASFRQVPKRIVLDIDDTFDAVHGGQQLRLFNAHYDEYGFQPIVVFDGEGRFVTAVLRPAKRPKGTEIRALLRRLLRAIRANWPKTEILLRADSHYCGPEVLDWCRANGVDFIFGVAPTSTLRRHVERLEASTLARYVAAPQAGKVRRYTEFYDGAASWSRVERIIARVEAGADGTDTRFIVTSLPTRNARVLYEERLLPARRGGEPHQGVEDAPGRRSHLLPQGHRQPVPAVSACRRLLAAVEPARADAQTLAVARGAVRHLAPSPDQDRRARGRAEDEIRLHLPTACPDQAILRVVLGRIPRLVT